MCCILKKKEEEKEEEKKKEEENKVVKVRVCKDGNEKCFGNPAGG